MNLKKITNFTKCVNLKKFMKFEYKFTNFTKVPLFENVHDT